MTDIVDGLRNAAQYAQPATALLIGAAAEIERLREENERLSERVARLKTKLIEQRNGQYRHR